MIAICRKIAPSLSAAKAKLYMPKIKSAASAANQPKPALPSSYEEAMAELESLIANMESGAYTLEASLQAYQRGAELVRYCQHVLDRIDQQILVLEAPDNQVESENKACGLTHLASEDE